MSLIHFLLVLYVLIVAVLSHVTLNESAFCSPREVSKNQNNVHFPLLNPSVHLPWIWDAVHDTTRNIIELTIVSRQACSFKHDQWKRIVSLFPQYSDQLGFGLESNILVNASQIRNKNKLEYPFITRQKHMKLDLVCVFLGNTSTVAFISQSRKAQISESSALGTISIECSAPPTHVTWSTMRVERNMTSLFDFYGMKEGGAIDVTDNATEAFSVCRLPEYKPTEKLFNLTVCTATANDNREQLVEWIEYHLLQGVQHFYLYNTVIPAYKQQHLQLTLSDYISQGIVTIIQWPYNNCVHKMASGRWVNWYDTDTDPSGIGNFFNPPRAIAQSAVLASCYSRFKHTSKYITHIDDDEFLFVSQQRDGNKNIKHKRSSSVTTTVLSYVQQIFDKHPNAPAVYFQPLSMLHCPKNVITQQTNNHTANNDNHSVNGDNHISYLTRHSEHSTLHYHYEHNTNPMIKRPPRLGEWNSVQRAPKFEGKLVMRTYAVKMFFVHYLTQLNDDNDHTTDISSSGNSSNSTNSKRVWSKENIFTPYLKNAALLHFKALPPASGSIWGQSISLNMSDSALKEQCDAAYEYHTFDIGDNNSGGASGSSGTRFTDNSEGVDGNSGTTVGDERSRWKPEFLNKHIVHREMILSLHINYNKRTT